MQLFFDFGGAPDIVQDVHHRFCGRFNDVGCETHAVEAATIVVDDDIHLTQGIFPLTFSRQIIFDQFHVVPCDAVNRPVDGVDWAITVGRFGCNFIAAGQFDRRGSDIAGAGLHAEVIQTEVLWLFLLFVDESQGFQIVIKHLAFFVGQFQEGVIQLIHVVVAVLITHLFHTVFHRGTAGAGGQVQLNLTSRSGRAAVKHRMEEMGYKDSDYNMDQLYDAFLKLADKKGQVFDYDLEALAFINKQQEEPEHFRLDYFSVQSGSSDIATASVKLACGDEVTAEAANGNGPVDAIYRAINRVTGYDVELVKYDLTAKGQGENALGQVDIVVNHNGRRFHGVGLATDIVESSAKAMVHVLNNIWRAAEVEKELQRKAQNKENNKETV